MKPLYKKSARAKHIRITIRSCEAIVVTFPRWCPEREAERFFHSQYEWVRKKMASFADRLIIQIPEIYDESFPLIRSRVAHYADFYKVTPERIVFRTQKTRWGSCSHFGTVSLNRHIAFLPPELSDYVIVHELCHLREFNHSKNFWELVARAVPDFNMRRALLKRVSFVPSGRGKC